MHEINLHYEQPLVLLCCTFYAPAVAACKVADVVESKATVVVVAVWSKAVGRFANVEGVSYRKEVISVAAAASSP
jgi:hypothetical protein